jgi:hypothetical protein
MATATDQVNRRINMSTQKTTVSASEMDSSTRKTTQSQSVMMKVALCIACGVVFGIAMHKAHGK